MVAYPQYTIASIEGDDVALPTVVGLSLRQIRELLRLLRKNPTGPLILRRLQTIFEKVHGIQWSHSEVPFDEEGTAAAVGSAGEAADKKERSVEEMMAWLTSNDLVSM